MKIFIIGGKASSGKTTFGEYLREELKDYSYKPCVMHITEPLYGYAKNYFDWNSRYQEKPREFLQKVGYDIIREKMGKKICYNAIVMEKRYFTENFNIGNQVFDNNILHLFLVDFLLKT